MAAPSSQASGFVVTDADLVAERVFELSGPTVGMSDPSAFRLRNVDLYLYRDPASPPTGLQIDPADPPGFVLRNTDLNLYRDIAAVFTIPTTQSSGFVLRNTDIHLHSQMAPDFAGPAVGNSDPGAFKLRNTDLALTTALADPFAGQLAEITGLLALAGVTSQDAFLSLNPQVVLLDSASGQVIANAVVNPDGRFELSNVSPGTYDVLADGDKHVSALKESLLVQSSSLELTAVSLRGGDVDGDEAVAGGDISLVVATFGIIGPLCAPADANCDGSVSGGDISLVVGNFGTVGPVSWE